ncbi:glycosyltransferase [Pseudarthrobacter oxydans]|uniref:glycosyltransferase n=1 Tax=Pseudarthrobacter oxydans TaxID=1671 RepID=UPI003D291723
MGNLASHEEVVVHTQCKNVVILSTADFDSPVWTNKQHLAVGLAKSGYKVYYIESLGLRTPTLSKTDIIRMLQYLHRLKPGKGSKQDATRAHPELPPNLEIISPKVIPIHGAAFVRAINRFLLKKTTYKRLPADGNYVLWAFSPLTYGLENKCQGVVYHSVDLLHTIPGVPAMALQEAEKALITVADTVLASSKGVARHLDSRGAKNIRLWENVASTELFASSVGDRKPRAIFAGNVTPSKIDIELLQSLVRSGVPLAVAGPIGIDGSQTDSEIAALIHAPGVRYLGNLDLPSLAREMGTSQVGLIPYLKNEYTRGVFPMKVYEYLAAGLSVVSTDIESLTESAITGLDVVEARNFADSVRKSLKEFDEEQAKIRSEQAKSNSWENRIKDAVRLLRAFQPVS